MFPTKDNGQVIHKPETGIACARVLWQETQGQRRQPDRDRLDPVGAVLYRSRSLRI